MELFTPMRSFLAVVAVVSALPPPARNRSSWTWDKAGSATTPTTWLSAAATIGRASATSTSSRPRSASRLRDTGQRLRRRVVGALSDGRGLLAGAGVEFDIAGPWKLAVDYSRVQVTFDQTDASTNVLIGFRWRDAVHAGRPQCSSTRRWTLGRTSARLCGGTSPTCVWMAASPSPHGRRCRARA